MRKKFRELAPYVAMPMMTSQILKFVDFTETDISRTIDYFFFK